MPGAETPRRLFVETTTRCNLRCPMCVKQSGARDLAEGDLTPEMFDRLRPVLPGVETLVLSGIGEPLLHPQLETFVATARCHVPTGATIGFQTNGVLLDAARARSLAHAGTDRVCVSVDAVSADTLGRIRDGADLGVLEQALASLVAAREVRPLEVGIEFVAMRENVRQLPEMVRWAARRGVDFLLVTQCLPYDESLIAQTAYDPNTDVAIGFFEPWRRRAREEGVDLNRYFEVLWKYRKTPEDQAVIDFVETMKAAAVEREVFLNLREVLGRDEAWYGEVEAIFRDAARVSAETGIALTLPEVYPRGDRCCEFVENDGMFVAWDGKVHPCYFLWHGYRCFVNGREKNIAPRVFGDLGERDALAIWTDPSYVEFRDNVRRYDYPYCSDCNLGKCCDYVQAEEFEQDCYINHEPCGDCLWCKGVFHCLQ